MLTPLRMHSPPQHGMTALAMAKKEGHEDCVALLKQVRVYMQRMRVQGCHMHRLHECVCIYPRHMCAHNLVIELTIQWKHGPMNWHFIHHTYMQYSCTHIEHHQRTNVHMFCRSSKSVSKRLVYSGHRCCIDLAPSITQSHVCSCRD